MFFGIDHIDYINQDFFVHKNDDYKSQWHIANVTYSPWSDKHQKVMLVR